MTMSPINVRRVRAAAPRAAATGLALLAAAPLGLHAQVGPGATARAAPVVTSFTIGGTARTTVQQTAVPVALIVPIGTRFSLDLATAYVTAESRTTGAATSRISGLTDTQLRASYTLGGDAVVLTAGVNLPTGRYRVAEDELEAAGRIGSDFLVFPVSSLGDGLGATAGVAAARAVGTWTLGLAASARTTGAFDAFAMEEGTVRFRPADEYRVRFGADRAVAQGRMTLGLTYSAFGRDAAGPTTYGTGDRIIGQAGWAGRVGNAELLVDGWTVHHAAGEIAGGRSEAENVADLGVAARWALGRAAVEPLVGVRHWTRGGERAGQLAQVGLRGRVPLVWGLQAFPSVTVARGSLDDPAEGSLMVRGLQSSVAVRWVGW
jgi:hypothetical protein